MREYETESHFDLSKWAYQDINRDYSEVRGSEELRNHFKILRTGNVFSPFRQYVWSEGRWYVSTGGNEGFYLNMEEAQNITFVELFYNLALARKRERDRAYRLERQKSAMIVSDELKENGI